MANFQVCTWVKSLKTNATVSDRGVHNLVQGPDATLGPIFLIPQASCCIGLNPHVLFFFTVWKKPHRALSPQKQPIFSKPSLLKNSKYN